MSEMTIKPRTRPAAEENAAAEDSSAGRANAKPAGKGGKVIKLGAKERLNSYVTPEQKRKLRLLAIEQGCSLSEIVGVLIDKSPKPEV